MRRKDKEITDRKIIDDILNKNQICRVGFSMNNKPYIVPMNYGYFANKIFLHSAKTGKKIEILKNNNNVCFEITDTIEIIKSDIACDFGTRYRSIIGNGTIRILEDVNEIKNAIHYIMYQHTHITNWEISKENLEKIYLLEIEIKDISGKKSGI